MTRRRESDAELSEYEDEAKDRPRGTGGSGTKASRWIAVLLLFVALVFMSFAAATPLTKKFYLFSVKIKVNVLITKVTDDYRFGVWGYCTTGVKAGSLKLSGGGCKDKKLGWTFKDVPGMSDDLQDAISGALTTAFVLHVIAAVTIFPAFIAAFIGAAKRDKFSRDRDREYREKDSYYDPLYKRARLCRRIFLFILTALIFTGIVFVLDLAGVVLTKDTVHDKSKGMATLDFGPAFWFVIAAFALVLLAFFIAVVDLAASGRSAPPPVAPRTTRTTTVDQSPRSEDPSTPSRYSREDDDRFYDVDMNSPQDEKGRRLR